MNPQGHALVDVNACMLVGKVVLLFRSAQIPPRAMKSSLTLRNWRACYNK